MKLLIQILVIGALVALLTTLASAQVPQMINYQGKLTTAAGAPVNGNYQMVFSIYADAGGTTLLWRETQPAVAVDKGVFNVLLGSVSSIPYSVFDGSTRYLGVKVGGDPDEILPRNPMVSVPYAYRAGGGGGYWTFRITDTADTALVTGGAWGIARYGNVLYGNADSTHVNLGVACTTGASGQDYKYCTVGGGVDNTASRSFATVGGGRFNTASGSYSFVGGGIANTASNDFATVGGGYANGAENGYATVGGGEGNIASGYVATVGGGGGNTASGDSATIGGGTHNTASNLSTTVGGGVSNTASGVEATVGGGGDNTASYTYTTVGGGNNNRASGYWATVGGGYYNTASGYSATVGGGELNTASNQDATVGGGYHNTASGGYATVPGGIQDTVAGDYSFATGQLVRLTSDADFTFAFGNNFTTSASHAVIFYDSDTPIKVGIQTTAPNTTTDINGDIALRAGSFVAGPGNNNDINIGARSFVRIVPQPMPFTITGIAGGQDGKIVILFNGSPFNMTIANENANSLAQNRIWTMTGLDEATVGQGNVTLIYDATNQRWIVTAMKP